jgi:polysaccharide export outer membrane protein
MPITGNETVLDALMYAGGLAPTASIPNVRLVRPAPPGSAKPQVLPVNLAAILQEGDTATNYQMMPGDRLHVYRDPIVRGTIFIDRLAAPFNTVMSSILQYTFAVRNINSINIPINGGGNNNNTNTGRGFNTIPANSPAR